MVKSVAIIGAGAAGLSAAAKLAEKGEKMKITILESRARIGGRIQTTDLFGVDVVSGSEWVYDDEESSSPSSCLEMGAQWAHNIDAVDHPLKQHIEPSGLRLSQPEKWNLDSGIHFVAIKEKFPSLSEKDVLETSAWKEVLLAKFVLEYSLRPDKNKSASARDIVEGAFSPENIVRFWDKEHKDHISAPPIPTVALRELAKWITLEEISNYYGMDASNLSWSGLEDDASVADMEHKVVQNGYARVLVRLAKQALSVAHSRPDSDCECQILFHTRVLAVLDKGESIVLRTARTDTDTNANTSKAVDTDVDVDGSEMRFDRVICTLPLGVLQHQHQHPHHDKDKGKGGGEVRWEPNVPAAVENSLGRLHMGLLHKTYVFWDSEADWAKVRIDKRALFPGTGRAPDESVRIRYPAVPDIGGRAFSFSFVINLDYDGYHGDMTYTNAQTNKQVRSHGYCFYSSPPSANLAEELGEEVLQRLALLTLQNCQREIACANNETSTLTESTESTEISTTPLPEPSRVLVSSWLNDESSRGAYSSVAPCGELEDFDMFQEPAMSGKLHFAGEHCQSEEFGCAHAALSTGEKAAHRVLSGL